MDELPLFRNEALESLRAPLEEGVIRIARSGGSVSFDCRLSLIGAMNPCPCGYLGDSRRACVCSDVQLQRYDCKLSGPFLDRFDMQVQMPRLTKAQLLGKAEGEHTAAVRRRVDKARAVQEDRYGTRTQANASIPRRRLEQWLQLSSASKGSLATAIDSYSLTGRGLDRVLRVARTIADLEGGTEVGSDHIDEALALRFSQTQEEAA